MIMCIKIQIKDTATALVCYFLYNKLSGALLTKHVF